MSTKIIEIKAPFWGAGTEKQFNWLKDGYSQTGIGLKVDDVLAFDNFEVVIKSDNYKVDSEKIKEICKKYNSYFTAKGNTKLAVFPLSIMTKVAPKEMPRVIVPPPTPKSFESNLFVGKACSACKKQPINQRCQCGYWTPEGLFEDAKTGRPTFRWLIDKPESKEGV